MRQATLSLLIALACSPVGSGFSPTLPKSSSSSLSTSSSSFIRPSTSPSLISQQQQQQQLHHVLYAGNSERDETDITTSPIKKVKKEEGPLATLKKWLPTGMKSALFALSALSPLAELNVGPADAASSGGRVGGSGFRSDAASSGGRVGGSGFRSAPSQTRRYAAPPSRSYSSPSRSYSSPPPTRGYVERVPIPVPYSPFGLGGFGLPYSPFMGGGYGVVSYRSGLSPIDIIILGGIAYTAFSILKNRIAGSSWDSMDEEQGPSSLGQGVTVLKLQVGLQVSDRSSKDTILGKLDDLAKTADVSTRQGLANLVSSTCMALLRSSGDWVSTAGESRSFGRGDGKAEAEYNRLAVRERSKFEKEVNMMTKRSINERAPYYVDSRPTLAVVTICVAIRGQSTKINNISGVTKLREALQTLAADSMTDDGENILATEVLWTPQEDCDVLTKRDLILDYPELIDL